MERRKVCVVVASRANLARITTVLEAVRDHPDLELQVVAAASALVERFGGAADALERAGFTPNARIRLLIEGQTPVTMAKSTGLGLLELPTAFEMLAPDIVVTVADRFETIATAIAAAYMNIPVAHTQGGEISGSIDESVRHAVTKLSHVHFPATDLSARRIVAMGEDPRFVFNVGCPSIDLAGRTDLGTRAAALAAHAGPGSPIDPTSPFVLVLQHAVTTEYGHGTEQVEATLAAVRSVGVQALVFWPNADAGGDQVAAVLRASQGRRDGDRCRFVGNLPATEFTRLMAHCACMVGNSSAALREGSYLGTPAVSVGTRQQDRECGPNVVFTSHDPHAIAEAVRSQVAHGPYARSQLFGDGRAGTRIADILATVRPPVQKRFHAAPTSPTPSPVPARRCGDPATGRVVVMGLGHVGLPLALRASDVGFDVVGFDVDVDRVRRLLAGVPGTGDVTPARLSTALASGRFRPTADERDIAGFDTAVITVPTPLREGVPDLGAIEQAAAELGRALRRGACVVLESTTYPGTTEEVVGPILEKVSGLCVSTDFFLGYSPERIDPGNREWTLERMPKVVSGVDPGSSERVRHFYESLVDVVVVAAGTREAELSKLIENTFRHVGIALVNELAVFAHDTGVDIWDAVSAAATKPFGFMPFWPGPGVGGHCLPIDPSYLSWSSRVQRGEPLRLIEVANDINRRMPDHVVERVALALAGRGQALRGRRVLLLGLAYKKGTGDVREAPAMRIAELFAAQGAVVVAADPHVARDLFPSAAQAVECSPAELQAADAVVVVVDHDDFDLAAVGRHAGYVLDCRNVVPPGHNVEHL